MAHDVIVLGSEPSALTAAAYLAKAGKRVLVLEAGDRLGGSMATHELLPGCRIDPVFDDIGWLPSRIIADLELERHGLALLRPDPMVVAPARRGGHLALWRDEARTRESIRALSTKDAEQWPRFAAAMARHAALLESLYDSPAPRLGGAPDADDLRGLFRMARTVGLAGRADLLELSRVATMSIAELLDDWFESDTLKGALAIGGVHGFRQGPRSGGTAFVFLHRHVGGSGGEVRMRQVAVGGGGALAAAVASAARSAGAEIRTGTAVQRIRLAAGRANGVVLANGDELAAGAVLSSSDVQTTLLELCDPTALDPEIVRAVQNVRYRGPMARVHLAVDELPRFRGIEAAELLGGALALAPGIEHLERAYDEVKYGRISPAPMLEVAIPTLSDPSRAPAATHVLSVTVQYVPHELREAEWTAERRDALGELVIDVLGEHAPGIRETIVSRCVLSPTELESCHGLREGSPDQGEMALDQLLFMRPLPGWVRYRMPIAGVWMCGPGTHPGGRIAGASGRLAAREILKFRG